MKKPALEFDDSLEEFAETISARDLVAKLRSKDRGGVQVIDPSWCPHPAPPTPHPHTIKVNIKVIHIKVQIVQKKKKRNIFLVE